MIISIYKKSIWETPPSPQIVIQELLGLKDNVFKQIKAIYENLTTRIIPNHENLKAFLLRTGPRQEYSFLPLLFYIFQEVLAKWLRQENEIKDMKIVKEVAKQFLFIYNMVLYIENYQYNDAILKAIRPEKRSATSL